MLSRLGHRKGVSFAKQTPCMLSNFFSSNNPQEEEHERIVIIGTGWAGYKLFTELRQVRKRLETEKQNRQMDIILISERNHFLYTPLLASTTVGTLEFRSITESVRGNKFRNENHFHLASVTGVDAKSKTIQCVSELKSDRVTYDLTYDTLVIACGARPNTFGIAGVEEHAFFLKEIWHARAIRKKILENFELATQPIVTEEEKKQLLHFVVVGGGPTGVEFCAELHDFVVQDMCKMYPQVAEYMKVSLVDAGEILSMFDKNLRDFALKKILSRPSMEIISQNCTEILKDAVIVSDGTRVSCGLVVWTAGVGPSPLTKSLPFRKAKNGNLLTNAYCQIMGNNESDQVHSASLKSIYAIGDCAEIDGYPLPATAQVAQTQAQYLVECFDKQHKNIDSPIEPYNFQSKGLMAYLGSYEGLLETSEVKVGKVKLPSAKYAGIKSWFAWRSAYLTKLGSWRLRMQVPIDWLKTIIVGRDVSRF